MTRAAALLGTLARSLAEDGWRIGFTNGCFDLLHPGHVHLLEQARSWCDRLVVGLNADSSVKRLKGPTRPVQPEAARAATRIERLELSYSGFVLMLDDIASEFDEQSRRDRRLLELTERYCVVGQSLAVPPTITVRRSRR